MERNRETQEGGSKRPVRLVASCRPRRSLVDNQCFKVDFTHIDHRESVVNIFPSLGLVCLEHTFVRFGEKDRISDVCSQILYVVPPPTPLLQFIDSQDQTRAHDTHLHACPYTLTSRLSTVVSKYLFGDANKESIIELPQGQLYIVRPRSPKGYSELIFKDAAASIRRTGQEFQYQLVVQRAYEEGEAELLAEDGEDEGAAEGLSSDKDEKIFLLDESLHFRIDIRNPGEIVLAWLDLSGDPDDLFEFVCDPSIQPETATSFSLVAAQCQYERKYRQNRENATEEDLAEFTFEEEEPIPVASPIASPSRSPNISPSPPHIRSFSNANTAIKRDTNMVRETRESSKKEKAKAPLRPHEEQATVAPVAAEQPEAREVLSNQDVELHLFDFQTGTFVLQDEDVNATVTEVGNWKYWLQITGKEKAWLGQEVVPELNPVFNFEYLSFIFNHYTEDGSAYSWLLRFKDRESEEAFQEGLMQALWEHLNETKWLKAKDTDRDYVLDAFNDLVLEDAEDSREAEAREEDEEEEARLAEEEEYESDGQRSESYDSDESDDDVVTKDADGNVNSQLAVGYKHDRSFVVRGSKIGVFKHTPDNHLEFSTNISKIETPNGKLFSPKKVMLHAEDRDMILQNPDDLNTLYKMDLEYGKIVDEWKVHDDIPVNTFAPESVSAAHSSSLAQLTLHYRNSAK